MEQRSLSLPARKGRIRPYEAVLACTTLFFLAYSLPVDWFRLPGGVGDNGQRVFQGNTLLFLAVFGGLVSVQVARFVARPEVVLFVTRLVPLPTAFIVLALMSTLWSADPPTTFRRAISLALASAFALFLALRFTPRQLLGLMAAAFAFGTVLNLAWIVALPSYGINDGNWSGLHLNKNGLGQNASFAMVVFWLSARSFASFRRVLYLLAGVCVVFIVFSGAASPTIALVALPAMGLAYSAFRATRVLYGAVVFTLGATAIAIVLVVTAKLDVLLDVVGKDASFTGRLPLWRSLGPEFLERPLLGYGWHGYFGGFFSPVHEIWIDHPWQPPHGHNTFIDLAMDLGLIGALLYLVFLLGFVRQAARFVQAAPGPVGLWPLLHVSLVLVYSFSETLKPDRDLYWVLLLALSAHLRFVLGSGEPLAADGMAAPRHEEADLMLVGEEP